MEKYIWHFVDWSTHCVTLLYVSYAPSNIKTNFKYSFPYV